MPRNTTPIQFPLVVQSFLAILPQSFNVAGMLQHPYGLSGLVHVPVTGHFHKFRLSFLNKIHELGQFLFGHSDTSGHVLMRAIPVTYINLGRTFISGNHIDFLVPSDYLVIFCSLLKLKKHADFLALYISNLHVPEAEVDDPFLIIITGIKELSDHTELGFTVHIIISFRKKTPTC